MDSDEEIADDKIYELTQENLRLRGQITYLQEELASVEDQLDRAQSRFQTRIDGLEQQLGDALYQRTIYERSTKVAQGPWPGI